MWPGASDQPVNVLFGVIGNAYMKAVLDTSKIHNNLGC